MVVDFHSHILPGIDDGSASVEESIEMLKLEAQQGIRHVIVTPHFYPQNDNPEAFLKRREQAALRLREAMASEQGLPEITLGAEVRYFRGISHSDVIYQLTIGGKRCILIEMPEVAWTGYMYQELEDIWNIHKIIPIIAHVDRYISPFRTHGIPDRLAELPVVVQANASFFLRSSTAGMAIRMLRQDKIHVLGSDCHNLSTRRPNLGDALLTIEKRLGHDVIDRVNQQTDMLLLT